MQAWFISAAMPWLNIRAYIYRTTLKTSESHLLSVVTNVLKQQLSDSVERQQLMRIIFKKNKRVHMTVLLSRWGKKKKFFFSFTSQIHFSYSSHSWVSGGSIIEKGGQSLGKLSKEEHAFCERLIKINLAYKQEFKEISTLPSHSSETIFHSFLLFSKFIEWGMLNKNSK